MATAAAQVKAESGVKEHKPTAQPDPVLDEGRWHPVMGLPCTLSVDLELPHLKVQDFLSLRVGSVLHSLWSLGRDVPLRVNGALIGWGELESISTRLAVRVTELA